MQRQTEPNQNGKNMSTKNLLMIDQAWAKVNSRKYKYRRVYVVVYVHSFIMGRPVGISLN